MQLDIRDLTIEYSSGGYVVRPVSNLNLTASTGSLVLLLGPSGCGKTTLLSCLGGILTPKQGTMRLGDIAIEELSGNALTEYRRHTVGIVFQAMNLVPSLTTLENVMVPLCRGGMPRREARTRATELLEQVGLAERTHHRPGALSGGQQQRVAIARALGADPPLLLADEPTAHLDYIQVEGVLKLLRELANGDRLVVVATHDQRMLPIADRVVELVPNVERTSRAPERVTLAAGEVLFRQGSWGELIYEIEEGEMEIVGELEGGREEIHNVLGPGWYFGEAGPIFGLPRSATARARGGAVVVGYTTSAFRERVGPLPIERIALDADVVAGATVDGDAAGG
ncbi:MAG TPA: ATP-binding cassette domain-containing protein [Acidimicrobiia bacterium]|nr:ATP-binding cassette domain-containing protein [Acidimicrobiia bacterium]